MGAKGISGTTLLQYVSGYHLYSLDNPRHITAVGKSFCDMTGYTKQKIVSNQTDKYLDIVHPSDRDKYNEFLDKLTKKAQTLSLEYRIICKNNSTIYVKDTMTSSRTDEGLLIGVSTLCDVTSLKQENNDLNLLNETVPCGILKYTCEKQPRITYINDQMLYFLRFPQVKYGELDYLELYKDNIFLMIPVEERRRFALYLNRVYSANAPVAGEMTINRCDGSRAQVFGWVTKSINAEGKEEFQSVCIDVTDSQERRKAKESKRYLKALTGVYDKIFEYNMLSGTVKCIYAQDSSMFKWFENVSLQMSDANEKWIEGTVVEEDKERVKAFFDTFIQKRMFKKNEKPPVISFRGHSSNGEIKQYSGIFLKLDISNCLFCCKAVNEAKENESLRSENVSLRENMQDLVMRFTDGLAAFEVSPGNSITPLYASDNVCEFFGYSKEEWVQLMEEATPLRTFVARSGVAYSDFEELFRKGEAEFVYNDVRSNTSRRIRAICTQKTDGMTARYVMLYNLNGEAIMSERYSSNRAKPKVTIRTFGYFDVFVGNNPIPFSSKKSKELLAILVDRRGGYVSSEEAIGFLWEDEAVNAVTQGRYRKVALRLKNTLEEYGIADIVESVDGNRRIIMEKVECDLYNYISGKEEYANLFRGSYLSNYSWGENTLAELTGKMFYPDDEL